ncbi:hypothetical protein HDU98_011694 [Podochytrium sp. JEL0797]|nr:hypothetical protein HDU98_011694 [Podochytrium sp. JEL0797]
MYGGFTPAGGGGVPRGVGIGFCIYGGAIIALTVYLKTYVCLPLCMDNLNTTSTSYYSESSFYAYNSFNSFNYEENLSYCETSCSLCYLSFPFAIIGIIVGFAMIKRSKVILNGTVRPIMIQVAANYPPGAIGYRQQHRRARFAQRHEFRTASPYAFAGPPNQQPPPTSPYAPRRLSLESLALQIQVPKLLDVKGGMNEVMMSDHEQLRDRYGITNEEFMRIKAYKKSIGQ